MIEYVVTQGEGTLLDHGLAEEVIVDDFAVTIFTPHYQEWRIFVGATVLAQPKEKEHE